MKVRLVIEGNVQGAGYRAMVKNVAIHSDLNNYA